MTAEIFADGVSEVNIASGLARINFVSLSGTLKDDKGNPQRELRQRVVITPQGVLELFGALQQVIERLVEAGLIQRRPDANAASVGAVTGAAASATAPTAPGSPRRN